MSESIEELKEKVSRLEQKIIKLEMEESKRVDVKDKLFAYATDADKFAEVISEQYRKMDELSNRLQVMINKECVLTEVSRYVRKLGSADLIVNFHIQLMRAYNWGDEFWNQQKALQYTIPEWLELIMTIQDPQPNDELQAQLFDNI